MLDRSSIRFLFAFFPMLSTVIISCGKKAPVRDQRSIITPGQFSLTPDPIRDCHIISRQPEEFSLQPKTSFNPKLPKQVTSEMKTLVPEYIQFRTTSTQIRYSASDSLRTEISLYVNNQKLCDEPYRVHLRRGQVFSESRLNNRYFPGLPPKFSLKDADSNRIRMILEDQAKLRINSDSLRQQSSCFATTDSGKWAQGWKFILKAPNSIPQEALIVANELKHLIPLHYELSTELQLYDKNHLSGREKIVQIHNMQGNGFLCSDEFVTKTASEYIPEFNYQLTDSMNPDNLYFQALSSFAYASEVSQRLQQSGMKPWYRSQVQLWFTDEVSTPSYVPPVGSIQLPTIILPSRGDHLKHFRTDSDVIYHEYGHHLVYKSARDITKNSVFAIHDGIADFLAYAMNNDPCLAESLCINEASGCNSDSCLRTGVNSLTLDSLPPVESLARYQHYAHAELISGLLWDLKSESLLTQDQSLTLILQIIEYLDHSADFKNFSDALIFAEDDLFQGKFSCKVRTNLNKRGFPINPDYLKGCDNFH